MYFYISKLLKSIPTAIILSVVSLLIFVNSIVADEWIDNLSLMSLEELLKIKVYTANRELTNIKQTPAVISVITAASIKRNGHKNLRDVLNRIPGFYNQLDISFALIGTRGFAQKPTNNLLMLIDGHNINSQAGEGIGNTHLLPFLYQVKQIEIVRGPGSTLWGGDAAFGIINIITYNGTELANKNNNKIEVNVDYEFDTQRKIANMLYGKAFDGGDLMLSATYTEAQGNRLDYYDHYMDNDQLLNSRRQVRHDQHRPSYEIQAKVHYGDFIINSRLYEHKGYYRNVGGTIKNEPREYAFHFIDIGYNAELSDDIKWETTLHYNDIDEAFARIETDGSASRGWTQGYDEAGVTSIFTYQADNFSLKTGVQLNHREFDGRRLFIGSSDAEVSASISGVETNYGIFSDLNYQVSDSLIFILGGRRQHKDLRQKGDFFLPRTAIIYTLSDDWTLKYAYNSGFVGTTLNRTQSTEDNYIVQDNGLIILGPEQSQKTQSHDLQLLYSGINLNANIVVFNQKLANYIASNNKASEAQTLIDLEIDGHGVIQRETNMDDLSSNGVEVEWLWRADERWETYGNYSYAFNKFDNVTGVNSHGIAYNLRDDTTSAGPNGQFASIPEHMLNVGVNYYPDMDTSLNIHYRAWKGVLTKQLELEVSGQEEFEKYGMESFIDAAITFNQLFGKDTQLQIYGRNLLDNRAIIGTIHGGATKGNGIELGLSLSIRF